VTSLGAPEQMGREGTFPLPTRWTSNICRLDREKPSIKIAQEFSNTS
jgi:hypothetical protein